MGHIRVAIALLLLFVVAHARANDLISKELERWRQEPNAYINFVPQKYDGQGRPVTENLWRDKNKMLETKDLSRIDILRHNEARKLPGRPMALPTIGDRIGLESFVVDHPVIKSLSAIEKADLKTGKAEKQPWSDDYWPVNSGILGHRYADDNAPTTWLKGFEYVSKFPATEIYKSKDPEQIDLLSPSEKYDLVMGTQNESARNLTQNMWAQGKQYYDAMGEVETWMGICHGWAPASYMSPRPEKTVEVVAYDGETKVKFYPSDIKGLTSLLWSAVETPTLFLGGRCNTKSPKTDENGRIIDQDCFDANPAIWHMAIVNRLGHSRRSYVFDATYDYQVWNQPIISYNYRYFNPKTREEASTLEAAQINIADHADDKFKKYRSPKAKYLVGVAMSVKYTVETEPNHDDENSVRRDATQSVTYLYDLEVNEGGDIIGGEWYTNIHPDFLWTPSDDAQPLTVGDYYLLGAELWDGKSPVPNSWSKNSLLSSERGSPLAKIVNSLLALSQKENP